MNLFDLTNDWFAYIRLIAGEGENITISAEEMKNRLISMVEEMEQKAAADTELKKQFEDVRYPLIVFGDEVLITSGWSESGSWAGDRLEMYYFQTMVGGEKFYKDLDALRKRRVDPEVLGIFFLCIALGFRGIYFDDMDQLKSIQMELCNSLPQKLNSRMDDLFPEAYLKEARDYTPRPMASIGKALFLVALATVIFLIVSAVVIEIIVS